MKWPELRRMSLEGRKEAERLDLSEQANWTPLLVYLHVSRMLIGFVLGAAFGCLVGTAGLALVVWSLT